MLYLIFRFPIIFMGDYNITKSDMKINSNLSHMVFIIGTCLLILTSCKKESEEEKNTITDYDGNVYNIVKIGDQEWMDRNLEVIHYRNGDAIHSGLANAGTQGAWCNYDNNPNYGDIYGKLYSSWAVHDARGLAPEGWHVATYDDWMTLINLQGGLTVAGGILKETGTTHWNEPNTGATDVVGFKVLPGGYGSGGSGTDYFYYLGEYAGFWTSTMLSVSTTQTYMFWFYSNNPTIEEDNSSPMGLSVRCIKD